MELLLENNTAIIPQNVMKKLPFLTPISEFIEKFCEVRALDLLISTALTPQISIIKNYKLITMWDFIIRFYNYFSTP